MVEHNVDTTPKNRVYIVNDIAMVPPARASGFATPSPQAFTIRNTGGAIIAQDSNGVVQASGSDLGAVMNTVVTGIPNHSVISFQTGDYSGVTTFVNNGHRGLRLVGNGAIIPIKFRFDGSGSIFNTSNCLVDGFNFSGNNAGIQLDNASYMSVQNCTFSACAEAMSWESTNLWSEIWSLVNSRFEGCVKSMIFKTASGGTASYIHGLVNNVTFNTLLSGITSGYTYVELESGAAINEGKWYNTRMWFNAPSGIGMHFKAGSSATRCQLNKLYLENFSGASGVTQGIIVDSGCAGAPMVLGRPTFGNISSFPFSTTFSNTNGHFIHSIGTGMWRETQTITPGVSSSFGTGVECFNDTDFAGLPQIYIDIGGTVAAGELLTVRFILTKIGGESSTTVTRTFNHTGTFCLSIDDYRTFLTNNNFNNLDKITVSAHTSAGSTSATISVGGYIGGGGHAATIATSGFSWLGVTNSGQFISHGTATSSPRPSGYIQGRVSGSLVYFAYYTSG